MRLLAKEETPLDWTSKKIGSYVLGHKGGAALRPSDFSDVGFPVIPKKAIQPTGELLIESPTYCTNEFASNNKRSIVDNSYTITTLRDLVPTGPTIGTVVNFTSEEKYILSQGIYGLKLNDDLDKKYLSYLSNTSFYRKVMQRIMVGSTQVHIRTPEYLDLEIQIPPLLEQQKIAKILSTWDRAISTTERLIDNSTQQKKALMQQLLTGKKRLLDESGKPFAGEWESRLFKNILKLDRGSSPRPIVKYMTDSEDGVNWIKIGDTKGEGLYINSTKERITKEGAEKSRKVFKGEVVLSNSMSYGKPYILNIDGYIHDGWFVIRKFEKNIDVNFLIQILSSELIQRQYKRLAAGGVVSNISSELVYAVKINLPSIPEQQKIATVLTNADKEIELLEQQLADLQQEKKALMQVLLMGKKRVVIDG
ncbi:restriction endonuclease subunit S [Psychrobacter sp. UBA3068]|uniref:restriction endonuclease subunit S n=1 Tax=Psychrobacter sp. UBA3068 TaxID=1947349 RepID=UPI00257EFDFA|nr:restriction endonuclease subunit S [Psychrobacter sp. UBA3068]